MNYQNIKLISSLITKNYRKILFVSKCLFRQVRINDKYLKYIYKDECSDYDIRILKYFISLYKELLTLNHKFSNILFNKLHDMSYLYVPIDLDLVKDLNELGLIHKYNFSKTNTYQQIEITKYLISVDFYNKDEFLSKLCRDNNFQLAKILIEELNIEVTCKNSIYHFSGNSNIEFIKYIFSKLPKHKVDFQELLLHFIHNQELIITKYLLTQIKIEKSTIIKIINKNPDGIIYLVKNNYITPDQELFDRAIESKNFRLIIYLHYQFNFDISDEDKDNLIKRFL